MPMLKIFATPADVAAVAPGARVVERYPAFVLIDAADADAARLVRQFPVEEMADQYRLDLGGGATDPTARTAKSRALATKAAALPPGAHHYVVQFIGPVKRPWLAKLRSAGGTLRQPMSGFAYVVKADEAALRAIETLPMVRWVGHLPHSDRVAPALAAPGGAPELPRRRVVPDLLVVEVFDAADLGAIERAARELGFAVVSSNPRARMLKLRFGPDATARQQRDQVRALSAVHGVRYIRERVVPRTSNNVATTLMGNAFAAVQASGLHLTGKGETVAVCDTGLDTGDPATIHADFAGRIAAIRSYPVTPDWKVYATNAGADDGPADLDSGHGTHVAGSVLGNGSASASLAKPIRGHAPQAKLVFQAIEQQMQWKPGAPANLKAERFLLAGLPSDLAGLFQFAYDKGARIHSNSWGGGDAGDYDEQCSQFDAFVWKRKDMCFVIAAGNDGTDSDGDGQINTGSVTSPGTAKNCITVGASENLRPEFNAERYGGWWPDDFPVAPYKADPMANSADQVAAFSSRGPTLDGRVKPDVVAPGTFILSTRSTQLAANNFAWAAFPKSKLYFHMGGTSMATPLTSGALALLREFLRTKRAIAAPTAALLKALLIAGARRLPRTAPAGTLLDNHQGHGAVNLDRSTKSVLLTLDGKGLASGQLVNQALPVTKAGRTLRVVMAYSDFPGKGLINNLNLVVTAPDGTRHVGNLATGASGASGATGASGALAMDTRNNVEVVQVAKARKGAWTVTVIASNVVQGPQDYAIAAVLV